MSRVEQLLSLAKPPVAIGFLADAPAELNPWTGEAKPAGCAFWKEAMQGKSFYTRPEDHFHCAVGAYTHGIAIPEAMGPVLMDTVGFMVGQGYIAIAEVPAIPVAPRTAAYIAYAPVSEAQFPVDVVIVAAKPASAMLLYEAAIKSGAGNALTNAMGRPGCAVVPLTMKSGAASLSFGCKGNRTYTGLPDDELYLSIAGEKWPGVLLALEEISAANSGMEAYYQKHADDVAEAESAARHL